MALDAELIKEIKQRADIVDVISFFVQPVIKKGRNYACVCPFHDDHDPSLQINKERQSFHCFVDDIGGDVFTFVQEYQKCSFEEAVRKVCEIIGFDDPRLHKTSFVKKIDENLVPLYNCINELQKYYVYALDTDEGKVARDYLDSRKLSNSQREKFGLGYAPSDGEMTITYLKAKNFSLKNIENIGISRVSTSKMSDHNQGRLIFPIKDEQGQVVGFSARRMNDNKEEAKYVNSPETPIFKKSRLLYNLHNAKQTCKHDGYLYITEGFMDVFALDSIGITSCVALMSTKLTDDHIEILKRLNVELRICLDGDKPGQEAMMKIVSQLDEAKLSYRLVSLPGEVRDPDEILKQDGEEKLKAYVNTLVDPFLFAVNYYKNISPLDTTENKLKVIQHFMPMILGIKSKILQDDYIYKLSEVTGISSEAIKNYLIDYAKKVKKPEKVLVNVNKEISTALDISKVAKELRRLTLAERAMLDMMFISKEAISFYESHIKYFNTEIYRQIANFAIEQLNTTGTIDIDQIITQVQMSEAENKNQIIAELSAIGFRKDQTSNSKNVLYDLETVIVKERAEIYRKKQLKEALEGKSPEEQGQILKEYMSEKNK